VKIRNEKQSAQLYNKPFWPRLKTLIAGVLMNFILAWVLLSVGYLYGLPVAVDDPGALARNAR